jgi:hypothetical protein
VRGDAKTCTVVVCPVCLPVPCDAPGFRPG